MNYKLSNELYNIYNILVTKQPSDGHKIYTYDCETHIDDYSNLGYWINKKLPSNINLYNKWFGDNVQHLHKGTVILLPTCYSYKNYLHKYSLQELKEIIINPDNYEFHNDGVQSTNSGIYIDPNAEITSFDEYANYLIGRGHFYYYY